MQKNVKRLHYIIYYGKIMNITNRKQKFLNLYGDTFKID